MKNKFIVLWMVLIQVPVCTVLAQDIDIQRNGEIRDNNEIRTYSFPPIQNFSDKDYGSYVQNWGVAQDTSGLIYIANLGEVLQYDGVQWRPIQVESRTALSIGRGPDGKMYVGGIGSFGYLDKTASDTSLTPTYHSLVSAIADSAPDLSNVWNILSDDESVYFDEQNGLYHLKDNKISIIKPKNSFRKSFKAGGQAIVSDTKEGLFFVKDNKLSAVGKRNYFIDRQVMAVLPYEGARWLIADQSNGLSLFDGASLTPLHSEVDDFLVNNDVYTGIALPDKTYLFGTLSDGLVHVDSEGRLLRKIDSERGLISDQVHSLFLDKDHNVWVALDNGLSLIEPLSPISYLDERNNLSGAVYNLQVHGGYLYASTSEGLFRLDIDKGEEANTPRVLFEPLFEDPVRCRDMILFNGELLVDCNYSIYHISGGRTVKLTGEFDIQFIQSSETRENYYYVIGRDGFRIFDSSHEPVFENSDFGHEFNTLAEGENGDIWIGTENSGAFRLESDFFDSFTNFEAYLHHYEVPHDKGDRSLRVFHIAGKIAIASSSGLFGYDAAGDSLARDYRFGKEMADPDRQVFLMEEDAEGNIWLRSNSEHQVLLKDNRGYRYVQAGLKRIDAKQVNQLYAHRSGLLWIAGNNRIIQYNKSSDRYLSADPPESFKTLVRGVYVRGDSLINADLKNRGYELEYDDNELRFEYAAIRYKKPSKIRYQVRLEGYEGEWSNWTSEAQKDYTNIPEGSYVFHVRAKDAFGTVSKADTFLFVVFPPWYRTWWAYSLYALFIGGILYGMHRVRINRILREQHIRNRIASDLHDEVSATLSSITYFAQAIRQTPNGQQERFVELISESAGKAKEKITDIIWSVDPEKDEWVDLLSKCRRFASDLFESKEMDYTLDIDTDIKRPLDLDLRQHLWLIFKEMTVNVARHSEADKVEVVFGMRDNRLKLMVQDDGIGMDGISGNHFSKGIKNIRNRAELIKAELRLEKGQSGGTRWIMTLVI